MRNGVWLWGIGLLLAVPVRADLPIYVEGLRLDAAGMEAPGTGRLLVPMRALFSALGARVEWEPTERAVYAWKEDRSGIRLALGENQAQAMTFAERPAPGRWGEITGELPLDAPAVSREGRVYVPLRFVAETLGQKVRYVASGPYVAVGERLPVIVTEAPVYCGTFTVFKVRGSDAGPRASRAMDVINEYLGGRVGKVSLRPAGKNIQLLLNNTLVIEVTAADAAAEKEPTAKALAQRWSRSLSTAFEQSKAQI